MTTDAMAVMARWRRSVKSKERRIFRFDERVELRLSALLARTYSIRVPLGRWQIRQVFFQAIDQYASIDADWRIINPGDTWGGHDVSAFFKRTIVVPDELDGQRVVLRFYIGGDSLLKLNGIPYHGLDPFRNEVLLADPARAGTCYDIDIESYVNWHTGEDNVNVFQLAELAAIDPDLYDAYWDFRAAFKVLATGNETLKSYLEPRLWEALKSIPLHEQDNDIFKRAVANAQRVIQQSIYKTEHFKPTGLLHLVGHSHLDIVFMWPYREFVRKIGRTHATMLRLMEQYPDFKFSQSQAKLYADLKQYYPDLYAQIKQRVAEGRWEPIGAFWVEPDCNLLSGESFVRQIIYGQRFWQEEFGVQSRTCWQPDVFGLSWALPQILSRAGIDYIMTNKMFVWNDTNRWTQNTFWWEGMDGSRVLAVVPPGHFIGMVDPDHMETHWRDFSDKQTIGESLYCYGWGDGGGGVDPEMLECALRYHSFPGMVPTQFSHAEEALDSIGAHAGTADLPVWRDELYLEAHRGVFTNKARLKKLNRQAEFLYREAEMLAAWTWLEGYDYPQDQLDHGWRMLLTTQFHDSLPGTHINEVYPQLLEEYEQLMAIAKQIRDIAMRQLFGSSGEAIVVFNSMLHARHNSILQLNPGGAGQYLVDAGGRYIPQQHVTTLDGTPQVIAQLPYIASMSTVTLHTTDVPPTEDAPMPVQATERSLENEYLRATFNANGELTALWDKEHEREVLVRGQVGNRFQLYDDQPGKYDAWDIIAQYTEHEIDIGGGSLTIEETGPLRASLWLEKAFLSSTLTQRISLYAGSRHLVFETMIDWNERQKLLKVGFPVEINTRMATYDIAYGNIERPTHRNTPYDAARFEVPAHLWMDVSEADYGVALLNDCKYGHEANGKLMRLTLLKGSIYPDPFADMETHYFTYMLYPHVGDWRDARVHEAALNLNAPLLMYQSELPETRQLMQCDASNITLEAVKRSEDGQHLVVRLVERHNRRTTATVRFDRRVRAAWSCNLMEVIEHELVVEGNSVQVDLKPYEIITLRIAH